METAKNVKHTEWLSNWEVMALQKAVEVYFEAGHLEERSGRKLIEKLQNAFHVRISYVGAR